MSVTFRSVILVGAIAVLAAACSTSCNPYRRIVCTQGTIKACFGFDIAVRNAGGTSTQFTLRVQNLQGTVSNDNAAWSQLLYLRVVRNVTPVLGFPGPGAITPTWDPSVQTIGPAPAGSGWRNTGTSLPYVSYSEWVGVGGSYGTNVGYVAGRDTTYNQAVNAGAGLRTYTGPGKNPGWVTFTFVATQPVTVNDVSVELSAWGSQQPASTLPMPQQLGCRVLNAGGGTSPNDCESLPYNLQ